MEYSTEVDWVGAWFGAHSVWDQTITFWLTATFAVVVAIHFLAERINITLVRLLAFLYAVFSIYTMLRASSIYIELLSIADEVTAMGLPLLVGATKTLGIAGDVVLAFLIVFGSVAVIYFILTAPRRHSQ